MSTPPTPSTGTQPEPYRLSDADHRRIAARVGDDGEGRGTGALFIDAAVALGIVPDPREAKPADATLARIEQKLDALLVAVNAEGEAAGYAAAAARTVNL
jgi:hypothetical protein